jgi:hypothetical protein
MDERPIAIAAAVDKGSAPRVVTSAAPVVPPAASSPNTPGAVSNGSPAEESAPPGVNTASTLEEAQARGEPLVIRPYAR